MSVFDLIVLVILIVLLLRGAMKGMVSQIVSVGSLFLCWIVASRFAFVIAPSIPAEEPWNKIGAMIVLFVVTMIAIRFVHGFLEKKLKDWHLDGLNRYLGGGLGLLKGLLICMVLTFFGVMLSEATREMVFQSKSGHHLSALIAKTGTFIPGDSCELLRTQIDLFNAKVNGTAPPEEPEDHLQMLFAAKNETENEQTSGSNGGTTFGDFFSRSNAVLDEIQSLRGDFQKETSGASSLLDAIGKWWNGSSSSDDTTSKTVAPAEKTASNFSEFSSAAESLLKRIETPEPTVPERDTAQPPSSPPVASMAALQSTTPLPVKTPAPPSPNESLFRTTPTYAPPTAEQLSSLLPTGSPVTASESVVDPIASGAMAIPQAPSSFRLSRSSSDSFRSSERLLRSTQTSGSGNPATVFSRRP